MKLLNNKSNKNVFLKLGSVLLACIFILGLVTIPASERVKADEIKPQIDVKYLGSNPKEPLVGQEIEIRYEITPHPFQHNISKPKEIVLVLDGSGSMSGKKLESLKNAARAFIDRLKSVNNLKVGIVVYSSEATINPIKLGKDKTVTPSGGSSHKVPGYESLKDEYLLPINDERLKTMINNIKALGGTNTGEGLRKGEFLLSQGDTNANKTLILMSDGLPTFYSVNSKNNSNYYTDINNENPLISGTGSDSSSSNVTKSTSYATTIGNIIKNKNYNIFSIGYGLGSSNSTGNKKMQEIHTSMGGVVNINNPEDVNNTFFASEEGAIDSIFNKIADKLEQFYNFNDANLQVSLDKSFTAVEGIDILDKGDSIIKIPPIVYELTKINGVDWYKADPIIISFKIKANKAGNYPIFNDDIKLEYTDINGNKISIPIESPSLTIKEFTPEDSQKLQVNFYTEKNGYLMGDKADVIVGFTHPGTSGVDFNNVRFDIADGIPAIIELNQGSTNLEFGKIEKDTENQKYNFNIKDDIPEAENEETNYKIKGKYSYTVNKGGSSANILGDEETAINIKRGKVIVNIKDTNGNVINNNVKVSLKGNSIDKESNEISNGTIKLDTVPSGNYNLKLTQIPDGYEFTNGNEAIVMVNYENNISEYTFILKGSGQDGKVTIEASDSSGKVDNIYNSEDSKDIRYDKFIKDEFDNEYKLFGESYADIKFSGDKLNYLQYQILKSDIKPITMPSDGWSEITAEDNGINEDIDIENKGKLTQKAYSVAHMAGLNKPGYNPDDWNKKELVYKYPFDGVRLVDASVASTTTEYAERSEGYNPVTNKFEERWVPKKVFTKFIDNIGDNYREASKTWGYFKAPEDGFYYFRTHSDDGIRFSITTDEGSNLLVDRFDPHAPTYHLANKTVKLKKDQYYPVFIEYFNVGGAAAFGVQYAFDRDSGEKNPRDEEYNYVDPGSFYPSKSTTPGESSDGSFEGQGGVRFPEEEGSYYVAYRGFNSENNSKYLIKEGFYGPFIIEDRFELERVVEKNSSKLNDDFKIKYSIKPKDIRITDIYKSKEELKEENVRKTLEIRNMHLKDEVLEGLKVNNITVESLSGKATKNISKDIFEVRFGIDEGETDENPIGIQYKLIRNINDNIEMALYKAEPIIVTLDVTPNMSKEYVFKDKSGILLYDDVSLKDEKIMKQAHFAETKFEIKRDSIILGHGLFNQDLNSNIEVENLLNGVQVVDNSKYSLGLVVDIKNINSKLELSTPSNAIIDENEAYIYEVTNGKIDGNSKIKMNVINGNSIAVDNKILKENKKYILLYTVTFNSFSSEKKEFIINAKLDKKINTIKYNGNNALPDLF